MRYLWNQEALQMSVLRFYGPYFGVESSIADQAVIYPHRRSRRKEEMNK